MSTDGEQVSSQNIDEIIKLPNQFSSNLERVRKNSLVGSFDYIKREFHRQPIIQNWAQYAQVLKTSGALGSPDYKMAMVSTDVIPERLASCVLEHEVIENVLKTDKSNSESEENRRIAISILDRLDLSSKIKVKPRWGHALATVHQFRKAQKEGLLDEMMQFANELESRDENRHDAIGNREFREAVYSLLTSQN